VRRACAAAGAARSAVYRARSNYPDFAAAWDEAVEEAADLLEAEARRRAVEGVMRLKFNKRGEPLRHPLLCQCGHERAAHVPGPACARAGCACVQFLGQPYYERKYSDRLLIVLLKAARPARFCSDLNLTNAELTEAIQAELARLAVARGGSPAAATAGEPRASVPATAEGRT
jgi:hypothetical protein